MVTSRHVEGSVVSIVLHRRTVKKLPNRELIARNCTYVLTVNDRRFGSSILRCYCTTVLSRGNDARSAVLPYRTVCAAPVLYVSTSDRESFQRSSLQLCQIFFDPLRSRCTYVQCLLLLLLLDDGFRRSFLELQRRLSVSKRNPRIDQCISFDSSRVASEIVYCLTGSSYYSVWVCSRLLYLYSYRVCVCVCVCLLCGRTESSSSQATSSNNG